MQTSNLSSVDAFLRNKALKAQIQEHIDMTLFGLRAENENLKLQVAQLQQEKEEMEGKFSTVRMQLQILFYLLDLEKLVGLNTVTKIATFFSALLNRSPQRARKPFSRPHELTYSSNKQTAQNIRRDLLKVQKLFVDFGLNAQAKKVQKNIDKLNEKHSFNNL